MHQLRLKFHFIMKRLEVKKTTVHFYGFLLLIY